MKCHLCKIILPILALFLGLLYVGSRFLPPLAPDHVTIATGTEEGIYFQSALRYKALLAKQHVTVEIVPTHGSVEALGLLKAKKVDIAFVQSGSTDAFKSEPFTSLASLYNEPIWVYYSAAAGELHNLSELKGKRIAVGDEGSGTKALALTLLGANGITPENSTLLSLGNDAGAQALFDGDADALFSIIGAFAPLTKTLLLDPKIKLLDFTRTHAYTVRYPFLNAVTLDEGVMDLEHNLPATTKHLIAATATLVSRDDLHPDLIRLVLRAAQKVHGGAGVFRKEGEFPGTARLEFPINADAEVYLRDGESWLESLFPFWIASIIKRLMLLFIPVIALMIPLVKLFLPLVTWRSRSKIYRWYRTLNAIEDEMDSYDASQRREAVMKLEEALQKIQKVDVPLSYRREYYDLIQHFELILGKLRAHS
ncbi:TAXI family TRAP transporter solute-binding subunit [Sulfurimonas sp. HSL-3221]|uniref:TAXI family TRAP transporter solute-binding subunit n=1 Tax=Sulfurimonadaceae TaxID=2771471 RepID=UPI001E4CB8D6|nr:TAXI family TRAP transporter solute-binding subunit [Sulfurimonas sp. HSL-3221]UFS62912.1 TAXI family TRAP transporter solute-binding subunit [Sulfurimonas sp. HSL-3221]